MPLFDETRKQAVRDLIGLPRRGGAGSEIGRISIAEVRRSLGLPAPPGEGFRSPDCWLGGSQVLRWLCGGLGDEAVSRPDFDFYGSSWDALDRAARRMLDAGFRFRQLRGWGQTVCHVCGRPARREAPARHDPRRLYPIHCESCGITSGPGAPEEQASRLVRLSGEVFAGTSITAVEIESPQGEIFQLGTVQIFSGPAELIAHCDFSLFQLVLDGGDLHYTRAAWVDLLAGRLRLTDPNFPPINFRRMLKYWKRGFRPYAGTALAVLGHYLRWEITARDPVESRRARLRKGAGGLAEERHG